MHRTGTVQSKNTRHNIYTLFGAPATTDVEFNMGLGKINFSASYNSESHAKLIASHGKQNIAHRHIKRRIQTAKVSIGFWAFFWERIGFICVAVLGRCFPQHPKESLRTPAHRPATWNMKRNRYITAHWRRRNHLATPDNVPAQGTD